MRGLGILLYVNIAKRKKVPPIGAPAIIIGFNLVTKIHLLQSRGVPNDAVLTVGFTYLHK